MERWWRLRRGEFQFEWETFSSWCGTQMCPLEETIYGCFSPKCSWLSVILLVVSGMNSKENDGNEVSLESYIASLYCVLYYAQRENEGNEIKKERRSSTPSSAPVEPSPSQNDLLFLESLALAKVDNLIEKKLREKKSTFFSLLHVK